MKLFFIFLALLSTLNSWAQETFRVGNIKYSVLKSVDSAVSVSCLYSVKFRTMPDSLYIPASVEHEGKTYQVLEIKPLGFSSYDGIRVISIAEGVRHIGECAFQDCLSLERVHIPSSVEEIDEGIFSGCVNLSAIVVDKDNPVFDSREACNAIIRSHDNLLVTGCKATRIPASVTEIGIKAFHRQHLLRQIEIPEGVKRISYLAFEDCSQIEGVSLPESLQEISGDAFRGCESLKSVYVPQGVESIEYNPFTCCPSLSEIKVNKKNPSYSSAGSNSIIEKRTGRLISGCHKTKIHRSVSMIDTFAFKGAFRLTSIFIPHHVTSIETGAFADCPSLVSITVDKKNAVYSDGDGGNCIIEKKTGTLITGGCFAKIPSSVTTIGVWAFRGMSTFSTLMIPESVRTIKRAAFLGCNGMKYLVVPGHTTIDVEAFRGCKHLKTVILGNGIKNIPSMAFAHCTNLKHVNVPTTVEKIADNAFLDTNY